MELLLMTADDMPDGMTADDTVAIPRELAERIYSDMAFGDAADELAAILNPPPEFDPEMVEAIQRGRWGGSWNRMTDRDHHRDNTLGILTAAHDAGWEMVEAAELEALRELVAATWDDVGDAFIAAEMTQAQADAIRKAKEAQR